MRHPFTILAIIVLIAFAALQAIRLWLGLDVAVNGASIPQWASAVALLIALLLVALLWIELVRSRDRQHDLNARRGGADRGRDTRTRSPTRAKTGPVWIQNGQRLPADYFLFASRGVSAKQVRDAAEKYDRIMVGFDAGNIPDATMKAARDAGAELEIYVEGPGGPTGNSWSPDESARVKKAAASVGVNTKKNGWMKDWDAWAWKAFTFKQLEAYKEDGFTAAEIDNLGRVLGEGVDPLIEFFGEYAEKCMAGRLPRLIMKNISEDQMQAVVAAVKDGRLPRAMFAEFHISERGSGDRKEQDRLSSMIGIRTVASNDTYNYDAFGEFGLNQQFAALLPKPSPAQPAAEVATAAPTAIPPAPATS